LRSIAENQGAQVLLDMLAEFDEESAKKIHPNNLKRLIRAIEFYKVTGVPISRHQEMTKQVESRYNPLMMIIDHDRDVLYQRINQRVDIMLQKGLIDEVKSLMEKGYTRDMNSMKGIGYKEVMDYLEGNASYEEMLEILKQSTRHYAKRQLTWFRRDERINYIDAKSNVLEEADKLVEEWLKNEKLQ